MSSLKYIYQDLINVKECVAIFMAMYVLNENDPTFLPDFNIDNDPNFYGIISTLLEDIVEMGVYMKRIAEDYPPYNVYKFVFTLCNVIHTCNVN